ncbi:MAG: ATP-binding cassette domain-containing protein [Gemmatimonadetes bacterium]|nr:ATP-binding cassette domain-containing protein [Gemmatimonadota bacterium]
MTSLLEARGVGMQFPGVRALSNIDFDLQPGEVHALIGENGAGKSTLVKILGGELSGYEGAVVVDGERQAFASPRDARAAGIAIIPQELQLVTSLTAAENICLGREPRGPGGLVDRDTMRRLARTSLDAVGGQHIAPDALVSHLETGDRQLVAIARALSLDARCLIMDEPTASLGAGEGARLESVVRRLAAEGAAVIYVSHKLDEVRRLADRITVLRDGSRVTTMPAAGVGESEMVRLMVGRDIAPTTILPVPADAAELLRVEDLTVPDREREGGFRLRDVSFTVRSGEIVGLAGLVGAGRTELLLALVGGLDRKVRGRIRLDGRDYVPATPARAREAGLVLLPEERKAHGIFPHLGVAQNITVSALERVSQMGWIDRASERRHAEQMAHGAGVRAAGLTVPMSTLSGGNQQKALLARCLFASPRVLLLDEPTRGIDLAAKADIYQQLRSLASQGYGIVLCSSEMSEILTQCHRIVVFRDGRVTATMDRGEATEEKVLAAAAGAASQAEQPPADRTPPGAPGAGSGAAVRWRTRLARYAGLFGLALVLVLGIVFSPVRGGRLVFLDLGNLTDILRQVAEKGILAVGMTAVVISGGIDLSVGSVLAFGATLSAWLLMNAGLGVTATGLIVLAASALWGLVNGLVVARWRLPAFIATLATMSAARGSARYLSGGTAIPLGFGEGGAPDSVRALAAPLVPYVPAPALIFGAAVLAIYVLLTRTRSGRYLYAIGDNETAARLSGVRVAWHKASVYVICATLAGLAGLVHCAQLEQGNPNDGVAYELDAIAAVVIGGTSLSGGTGTVGGTVVGILIIGIINNIMGLNNVDANLQLILKGVIILVAVWLQRRR